MSGNLAELEAKRLEALIEKLLDNYRRLTGREDQVAAILQRLWTSHQRQLALAREWTPPKGVALD